METWRESLKDKPVKYWIRTEIKEIIKENSLNTAVNLLWLS